VVSLEAIPAIYQGTEGDHVGPGAPGAVKGGLFAAFFAPEPAFLIFFRMDVFGVIADVFGEMQEGLL